MKKRFINSDFSPNCYIFTPYHKIIKEAIPMDKKKLIINLLKDHLINARLMNGLKSLGFHSEDYHLQLSNTIFELLEIDDKDDLFENYLEWCTQLTKGDLLKDADLLNLYANGMYEMLSLESKNK